MENLKMKMLKFGIYGTKLSELKKEDLEVLYNKNFTEIFYTQDIPKLEENLNGEKLTKIKGYETIMENLHHLSIRIKFSIFKENIVHYKFKEEYPYKFIDYLLRHDGFIKSAELREQLKIDSKRIFYVAKKLKANGVLEQKQEGSTSYLFKLNKDLIFKNENPFNVTYGLPIIPCSLNREIPILDQIRDLIKNTPVGITTEDLHKHFGLSMRQGLNYLHMISDVERHKYKFKEIFIGKIRRLLFFVSTESDSVEMTNLVNKNFITIEDRKRVLDMMLEDKKGFVINEDSLREFKSKLNSNFIPCKKTVISTALKSGHKIFTLKEKNESKTLVINKDMNIADYLNETRDYTNIEFKNQLERLFFKKFVMGSSFIVKDNLYLTNEKDRLFLLCDFLHNESVDGYIVLDQNLIDKMTLKFLFQILPVDIPNIIPEILQEDFLDEFYDFKVTISKLEKLFYSDLYIKSLPSKWTKKLKVSFCYKRILNKILDLENAGLIQKYCKSQEKQCTVDLPEVLHKYKNYQLNTELNIIGKSIDKDFFNNPIVIKLLSNYKELIDKSSFMLRKTFYIEYIDRIKCFNIVRFNEKNAAYRLIKRFIKQSYTDIYKHTMKKINEIFGNIKENKDDELLNKSTNKNIIEQEFLYTKIKYDLIHKDCLDPAKYKEYCSVDLVLNKLKEDGILIGIDKKTELDKCEMRTKIKLKLRKNLITNDNRIQKYIDRDTIYRMYFVPFYELLVKTGSMEINDLLEKVKLCKDFEFYNFVKAYNDVFEISEVDNFNIVSVKIDIDTLFLF